MLPLPDTRVITYTYHDAHLVQITDQAGSSLYYTVDNVGNRAQEDIRNLGGSLSRTITRAPDALGRLQTLTEAFQ